MPCSPAANSTAPILQACPMHHVDTGDDMCCIVSYIANPAVTTPPVMSWHHMTYQALSRRPGELRYMCIGFLGLSDCRNSN